MGQSIQIQQNVVERLRQEILAMQGLRVPLENELRQTGLGLINQAFPNETFPVAAVHEFISTCPEESAATAGFISGLLGTLMCKGCCLWVGTENIAFAPALKTFGVKPDQVIFINPTTAKEALWIIEEGLKCEAISSVVGEIPDLGFTESRRLQLAVERSRVTGFILRCTTRPVGNVACVSRWRIRATESYAESNIPGVGMPSWEVELQKIRSGRPGSWLVHWSPNGFLVEKPMISTEPVLVRKTG